MLILVAIILDLQYPNADLSLSATIKFLEAIGIAILVAAVFTFASGTSEFIDKVRQLLQDIVLSRKFLGNIDEDSKREALKALIRPSAEEQRIYSNVEDYYDTCISHTMSISKKCVRSNYHIHCKVWYDSKSKRLCTQLTNSYRLYPTKDGFSDIEIGYSGLPVGEVPICDHLIVSAPSGRIERHAPWKLEEIDHDGQIKYMAAQSLKEIGEDCPHLDIETRTRSKEHDHWAVISFKALQPIDGFRYHVQCEDCIHIQNVGTFSHGAQLKIDHVSDTELFVRCNQWLNEGAGLFVIMSKYQHRTGVTS